MYLTVDPDNQPLPNISTPRIQNKQDLNWFHVSPDQGLAQETASPAAQEESDHCSPLEVLRTPPYLFCIEPNKLHGLTLSFVSDIRARSGARPSYLFFLHQYSDVLELFAWFQLSIFTILYVFIILHLLYLSFYITKISVFSQRSLKIRNTLDLILKNCHGT